MVSETPCSTARPQATEISFFKKWWDTDVNYTSELIQEKYGSYVDGYKKTGNEDKPIQAFIIYFDDTPIGYIQYYNAYDFPRGGYELNNLPDSLAAIDIFIDGENYLGKGIKVALKYCALQFANQLMVA